MPTAIAKANYTGSDAGQRAATATASYTGTASLRRARATAAYSGQAAQQAYTVPPNQFHLRADGTWGPFIVVHLGTDGVWRNLADGRAVVAPAPVTPPPVVPTTLNLWKAPQPVDAALGTYPELAPIAAQPQGVWLASAQFDTQARVQGYATAAAGKRMLLVVYNIPGRDNNNFSAGGFPDRASYLTWVTAMKNGVGSTPTIFVYEPDALGLSRDLTVALRDERRETMRQAATILRQAPNAEIYIDASMWVPAVEQAALLQAVGVAGVAGFSINVANYKTQAECYTYGNAVVAALSSLGITGKKFIVDSSRNGAGPLTTSFPGSQVWFDTNQTWCNPPGRRLGLVPQIPANQPNCAALLWIKNPGESDGPFPTTAQSNYYGSNAPAAGALWPELGRDQLGLAPTPTPTAPPPSSFASVMPSATSYTDPETGSQWARAYAQDFSAGTVPLGSQWNASADGNLPSSNRYAYSVAGPGVGFNVYNGNSTTSGVGQYHPVATTQVKQIAPGQNVLSIRCHTGVGTNGVTRPLSGTFVPRIPGYFTRFHDAMFRYRVTNRVNNGAVYGGVWQSISEPANWPEYGEHDFPEFSFPNRLQGNFHPSSILRLPSTPLPHDRTHDQHTTYTTAQPRYVDDWVTCRTKWEQVSSAVSRLRWWVAGPTSWELIMDRTQYVYNQPLVFMFQCGDETYTAPDGTSYVVAPTTEAEVQIDWCHVYLQQGLA